MHEIEEKLRNLHTDNQGSVDEKQLEVIFSADERILVEAPAGYGKTKTMISKIAYLIASNQLFYPKKILALTYSVNAAYKIKRDISIDLPEIFDTSSISPLTVKNKIFTSNYHGLCRIILKRFGYLLDSNLENMENILGVNDSNRGPIINLNIGLNGNEIRKLILFNQNINQVNSEYVKKNFDPYLEVVKDRFLPNNIITFNAIILLVIELFKKFPNILTYYQKYFPIIIIDEFQDTNLLSWSLVKNLITENSKLVFMGDSLQRIYGFMGAIEGIMDKAKENYGMKSILLNKNHRFSNNLKLLTLDKNLRENAKDILNPDIDEIISVDVLKSNNQSNEAERIFELIEQLLNDNPNEKIIVLVRNRNGAGIIIKKIKELNVFNALFSDEERDYVIFHQKALNEFLDIISKNDNKINKNICEIFIQNIKNLFSGSASPTINSLIKLLISFLRMVFNEYKFLILEEKIEFIIDVLEGRALKQYLEYVDSNLIISTIHGAKGLEWDNVIIPHMKKNSFPSFLCRKCEFRRFDCKFNTQSDMDINFKTKFMDELNVFYVGTTRAKKNVHYSFSGNFISCFLKLEGIDVNLI